MRLEAAVAAYQAKMAQATAATTAFGSTTLRAAADNKAGFTTMGIAALAFGGALAFGLKAATDKALEFQANLVKMQTLVGLSASEVDKLGQAAIGLADTGVGPIELSDALYFITSSGIQGAAAMKVLEASAKASAIGLGDTAVVADAVTSAVNAYGQENLTAARATDILAEAVNQGKLEADQLAPVLGNILPLASALGVSFEDVAGSLAVLSLKGTDAAEGATQISGVLASLLSTSPKVTEALGSVNLTMEDLRTVAGQDGLFGVMNLLNEAFHGNIEALRAVFPNIRAFRAVMSALSGDSAQTAAVLDAVANSTGTVDKAFQDWGETAVAAKAKFNASFEAMQVVLGTVFLPVLAKVFDAFRGFADFITNLPGPIRAIAVGMIAVAAALLLIGGAALLALPRILAMRTALQSVSGTGIGKALGGTASFLTGPWGVAIAAATVGIGIWAAKQEEARRRVEELTQAIQADSGAIGANTKELVINRLQKEGVLEAARRLNIELPTLVDAFLGDAEAQAELAKTSVGTVDNFGKIAESASRVHGPMTDQTQDVMKVREAYLGLTPELDAAKTAAEEEAEAIAGSSDEHIKLNDLTEDTTTVLEGMQEALDSTKEAADALTTALELLAGAQINEKKASLAWLDSLSDLREELKNGTKTLTNNTEAGRENQSAILDSIDAALAHGEAVAQETGSVEQGAKVVLKHIKALEDEAVAAGFSRKEIREYIAQLNLTPEQIRTQIKLLMTEAQNDLARYRSDLGNVPRFIVTELVLKGPGGPSHGGLQHAGGIVGSPTARRMHGGGKLRGDEEMFIGQRGEQVLSLAQLRMLRSFTGAGAGGMGGSGGGTTIVVDLDVHGALIGTTKRELAALLTDEMHSALLRKQRGNVSLGIGA